MRATPGIRNTKSYSPTMATTPDLGYPISVQTKRRQDCNRLLRGERDPIFKNTEEGVVNAFTKAIIWQLTD